MPSVVIIDDEVRARHTMRRLLTEYCPEINILGEADGVASGILTLKNLAPDVVFLDIRMKDGTGFDLLDHFPNPDFKVVFTTAYDQFAVKAFSYNAVHYLLKPIDPEELQQTVRRLESKKDEEESRKIEHLKDSLAKKHFDRIALSTNEGLNFFYLRNIIRLESSKNYTLFFISNGERLVVARTLKDYEEVLPESDFFRTHQSHIINRAHVRKLLKEDGGSVLMTDESKVPVARRKKEALIQWLKKESL